MHIAHYPEIARAYLEIETPARSGLTELVARLRDIVSKPVR